MGQSTEMTDKHSAHFYLQDEYEKMDFSFLEDIDMEQFILLQEVYQNAPVYKVVYEKQYFKMSNGEGFFREDFVNDMKKAICGIKTNEIIEIQPFEYAKREYKISGVLEDNGLFLIQYGLFFADGTLAGNYNIYKYILDGRNEKEIIQILGLIEKEAEKQGFSIKHINESRMNIKSALSMEDKLQTFILLFLILNISTIILLVNLWIRQYKEEYIVYQIFGIPHFILKIIRNFTILYLLGFFVAILLVRVEGYMVRVVNRIILLEGIVSYALFLIIIFFSMMVHFRRGDKK